MIKIDVDKKKVLETIDSIVRKTMTMDVVWDWPCGVAYYGISEAYELTKNEEYLQLLKDRIDEYIEVGLPSWNVNACAMGHCLITLYEATGEEKYWKLLMEKIDYIKNDALRFGDRVLQHTVSSKNDFPEQAWADTLFMAGFLMLRVGIKLKDEDLINDALNQFYWHIKYLQDPETGLWYHGYNNINKDHMSGMFWGRANSWGTYTMSQVKKRLPEADKYPKFADIDAGLQSQLAGLIKVQTENGLWRTLLDDEISYEEISASCGIAAGMVENGNPLHAEYVEKAYKGIMENISSDGRVLNVSGGTAVMKDKDGYRNISKKWIQGWGQGLALAFLTALIQE